jgi:Zn-finger protein
MTCSNNYVHFPGNALDCLFVICPNYFCSKQRDNEFFNIVLSKNVVLLFLVFNNGSEQSTPC